MSGTKPTSSTAEAGSDVPSLATTRLCKCVAFTCFLILIYSLAHIFLGFTINIPIPDFESFFLDHNPFRFHTSQLSLNKTLYDENKFDVKRLKKPKHPNGYPERPLLW